ncbi:uncharacterized protein TNCV_1995521 [Trichonephila clavipes]|nr:uncharacterized protein TNCV_1995521 [Trichonephila clavipes]
MDTQTLLRLAHSDYKIKRTFGGVFASDILSERRGHYRSFIVNTDSSMSTVLKGASKKRKIDISEKEKNSVKHKTTNKRLTRFESESDVESINDEDERNSLFGKNRKPWSLPTSSPGAIESRGPLNQHEKYDVVISDDLRLAEEIPPLSVYVGAGFAAEIKTFHESRSFFRVHTGYFSNIPKCIKAEFIASWGCSQSSVVSSSQR